MPIRGRSLEVTFRRPLSRVPCGRLHPDLTASADRMDTQRLRSSAPRLRLRGELYWQTVVTFTVPVHEPVKFEPPPPRAPPMTKSFHGMFWLFTPSGVPAWSLLL